MLDSLRPIEFSVRHAINGSDFGRILRIARSLGTLIVKVVWPRRCTFPDVLSHFDFHSFFD